MQRDNSLFLNVEGRLNATDDTEHLSVCAGRLATPTATQSPTTLIPTTLNLTTLVPTTLAPTSPGDAPPQPSNPRNTPTRVPTAVPCAPEHRDSTGAWCCKRNHTCMANATDRAEQTMVDSLDACKVWALAQHATILVFLPAATNATNVTCTGWRSVTCSSGVETALVPSDLCYVLSTVAPTPKSASRTRIIVIVTSILRAQSMPSQCFRYFNRDSPCEDLRQTRTWIGICPCPSLASRARAGDRIDRDGAPAEAGWSQS